MRTSLCALFAAALIALPALATQHAPQIDYGAAIEKRWDAFFIAWVAGDAQACAAFFSEDGLYSQKWRQADREMTGGYFAVWTVGDGGGLLLHRLIFN